ncbi:hypothetical protein [Streptomyces sp. NPDC095613]|uniref:hypothetical protein n=1 Tax=Streptomyces sp. NPDC095613 TaxID=3155540 RepID=UPI0033288536
MNAPLQSASDTLRSTLAALLDGLPPTQAAKAVVARQTGPAAYWAQEARNKKSVTLDLRTRQASGSCATSSRISTS